MDKLFNLIHSLDAAEKKFFKQFSERGESASADYIKLFDAINDLRQWNEESLKKKFPEKQETFTKLKRYLYDSILKAMSAYSADHDERANLYRRFVQIQFLHKKTLYNEALELIHSSQEIAISNDYLIEQVWLLSHEILVINAKSDKIALQNASVNLYPKAKQLVSVLDNWFEYRSIYGVYRTNPNLLLSPTWMDKEFDALQKNPLLDDEKLPLSNPAKRIFYELNYIKAKSKASVDLQIQFLSKLIKLYATSSVIDYQSQSVLSAYTYNLVLAYYESKDEMNARAVLQDLKSYKMISNRNVVRHADRLFYASLLLEMKWGDSNSCETLIHQYRSVFPLGLKERISDVGSLITSYQLILLYQISRGAWDFALDIQNQLICHKELANIFPDVAEFLRLSNLIIHFELGNLDLCSNLIRQMEYTLHKHLAKGTFTGQFVKLFKQLIKSTPSEKRKVLHEIEKCMLQGNTHLSDYSIYTLLKNTGWPKRHFI